MESGYIENFLLCIPCFLALSANFRVFFFIMHRKYPSTVYITQFSSDFLAETGFFLLIILYIPIFPSYVNQIRQSHTLSLNISTKQPQLQAIIKNYTKKPPRFLVVVFLTCVRRFELPTFWSVAKRSIQLSYTHIFAVSFPTAKFILHHFPALVKKILHIFLNIFLSLFFVEKFVSKSLPKFFFKLLFRFLF